MKLRALTVLMAAACWAQTADTFHPWEGVPAYYRAWPAGPPAEESFFPISVWLQDPARAAEYKAIGINLYIGLHRGPTQEQLAALAAAGITALASQNETAMKSGVVRGWTQRDEPDNAQAKPGGGWGSCILPEEVIARYNRMKAADPTRPVYLNLGQAVANDDYKGRGEVCSRRWDHYPEYIRGADIVSYDIYPVNYGFPLWWVGKGIDRLRKWADYKKPVWVWIEASSIRGKPKPTPHQIKAQVWMAIMHGALGIGYFCHQFQPERIEHAPLADSETAAALKEINAQVTRLAPVLNTPSVANGVTVSAPNFDFMLKRHGGATYLFAMSVRPGAAGPVEFRLRDCGDLEAEVLGESRTIQVKAGAFTDRFEEYGVHIYRLAFDPARAAHKDARRR